MKKLVVIFLVTFSSTALAVWSAFAHVTPATESKYQINVEFSKFESKPNQKYRVKIPAIGYGHQKTWLVLTAQVLNLSGEELRAFLWWKEQPKERVLSILELKVKNSENGPYYEHYLTEYEAQHGYIYVDYPGVTFDGGYYYSIDLRAYLSGLEASANK